MPRQYTTNSGEIYSLSNFSNEERALLSWLQTEYEQAQGWASFQQSTLIGIINVCKRLNGENWAEHPLYKIHRDMATNAGIRAKDLRGELSLMFTED